MVCDICHSRPVMDRCSCCENCWYSGAYRQQQDEAHAVRMMLEMGIDPAEVAGLTMDARRRASRDVSA